MVDSSLYSEFLMQSFRVNNGVVGTVTGTFDIGKSTVNCRLHVFILNHHVF